VRPAFATEPISPLQMMEMRQQVFEQPRQHPDRHGSLGQVAGIARPSDSNQNIQMPQNLMPMHEMPNEKQHLMRGTHVLDKNAMNELP